MIVEWTVDHVGAPLEQREGNAQASSIWTADTVERALADLGDRMDADAVEQRAFLIPLRGKSSAST